MSCRTAFWAVALLAGCAASAAFGQNAPPSTFGENPQLSPPRESWLPTLQWAAVEPWPEGRAPKAAEGLKVQVFARGLKHPRWIYQLPNGDVLVAEAASEPSPSWSPRSLVQNWVQRQAHSIVENANRISILRDTDGDGTADQQGVFLEGLRQPFGMALIGDQLYVANTDGVVRFPYKEGQQRITEKAEKIVDIPVGHHWTRNIMPTDDGKKLFVTVGSGSNIGEKGMEIEKNRAAIWELDLASGNFRLYASGLRNPNGLAIEPSTGKLWTVVNERDEIGNDVPPDYLTSVQEGGFYGWPYSYWGKIVDNRVQPQQPELVAKSITPDYALGAHTSSMGLAWYDGETLPQQFRGGMFIGQHGSWNREPYSGYKVIFVPFKDGKPAGPPRDVLTGFLNEENGTAYGRPVGVVVDRAGALLVADDAGNTIWRITGTQAPAAPVSGAPAGESTGAGAAQ